MQIAPLDVQLIAHTMYRPPRDRTGAPILANAPDAMGHGDALAEFAGRSCYQAWNRNRPKTATNAGYLANIIEQKHFSVLEHGSVTFYIQGVSRALTHELIRHRHLSYSQSSQRYVDANTTGLVIPPLYENDQTAIDVLEHDAEVAIGHYNDLVQRYRFEGKSNKVAREAARALLPNAMETRITVTGNYRAWIEFLIKRDSLAADAEFRRLAQEIGRQLETHAPNIFGEDARPLWDLAAQQGTATDGDHA